MSMDTGRISKADAAAYSSSASSDEDDDFDPQADEFRDHNPRKRRRTGRNAKESAALGIFGSESEDDGPGKRWKSKNDLRHKNVAFVSAGQERLNQDATDDDDDEDEDERKDRLGLGTKPTTSKPAGDDEEDEDEDEDEEMTGVGLGFGASSQGLGWAPPTQQQTMSAMGDTPSKPPKIKAKYGGNTPLGRGFVPSSANEPVLKANLQDDKPSPAPQTPKPSAFGGGGKKSFAARMMEKMGYVEGQGLGADGQGRNVIIEANLRPQGVGLGAVKEKSEHERKEEKRQARLRGEEVIDSDEERKKAKRERKKKGLSSTPVSGASTPKRPKKKFLTVTDIQKAAPGLHIPDAFAPILDLTGRDQKLLTSSSALLTPTTGTGTEVAAQTEARKLAIRAQGDLAAFVEEWKNISERKAWIAMEESQCQQELDNLEGEFSGLSMFSSVLDGVYQAASDRQWDLVIAGLKKADSASSTHGDKELASIAVSVIHPFLKDAVQGWQPLDDPKLGNFASDLSDIKGLLDLKSDKNTVMKWQDSEIDGTHRHHTRSTTPWESMVYQVLFPKLVTAISQTWDVHDAAPLLGFFERWELLLPDFVRSTLIEQVVRRLEEAVSDWKPKKKHENLHIWLFPWLQYLPIHHLDPKGTGLVAEVRRKFRQLIDAWDYSKGTVPGLKQWKDVFRPTKDQDQWRPLVMHHILPGMGRYLRTNFRVDPSDQEPYLEMLNGVLKWTDVISTSMVGEVIVSEVFPMWHDILYQWLTSTDANYEEVGQWFEWWKDEVFPKEITSLSSIAAEFEKGTVMIETALDLGVDAKNKLPRPDGRPAHQPKSRSHKPKTDKKHEPIHPPPPQALEKPEPTFRDEVEEWCQENDLQFIPVRKANEEGKHYFRITARMDGKGGVLAYFRGADNLVVESRKTNLELKRDIKDDWGLLLEPLYQEVEQGGKR